MFLLFFSFCYIAFFLTAGGSSSTSERKRVRSRSSSVRPKLGVHYTTEEAETVERLVFSLAESTFLCCARIWIIFDTDILILEYVIAKIIMRFLM